MLTPVADGVFVHRSELLRNLTVVVHGRAGTLVVDPGITAITVERERPRWQAWIDERFPAPAGASGHG